MSNIAPQTVTIIGAGPSGLIAAEVLCAQGYQVHVYDAKPSACRKLLVAGIGGLNITHSEPYEQFIQRYYEKADWMHSALKDFDADRLVEWVHELGVETMVGSSGRVFPADMKAAPLLRGWLRRLRESGVQFHMRHRLIDLQQQGHSTTLQFEHKGEVVDVQSAAVLLSLGGASWPKLGSDGAWQDYLSKHGVAVTPLQAANCGFISPWSDHLKNKFSGEPLKNIAFNFVTSSGQHIQRRGECIVSDYGLEGSLIYAYSKHLRDSIQHHGKAPLNIDLLPDISAEQLIHKLNKKPQGKDSFAKYLKRSTGISGLKAALLYECFDKQQLQSTEQLATAIKAVPIILTATAPLADAISTAGGVSQDSLTPQLMLKAMPGVFCAGEMLDWEAPTGGYLLTACFATGKLAAKGIIEHMQASQFEPIRQ